MEHSDDQSVFAPDDDLTLEQEISLLKKMVYKNSAMTETEYELLEKEIKDRFYNKRNNG